MRLSVIVPLHNERATAAAVLDRLLAEPGLEIVVVESGSTDGTRELAAGYAGRVARVIHEPAPRGKGAAVREGLRHVTGELVLVQDGDLEYSVDDYPQVLAPLREGRADVVLGVRPPAGPLAQRLGRRLLTALFNLLHGTRLQDGATMFKLFRTADLRALPLESDGFDYDWEWLGKLARRGARFAEVPVRYSPRGESQGKKLRPWRDGLRVLARLLRLP